MSNGSAFLGAQTFLSEVERTLPFQRSVGMYPRTAAGKNARSASKDVRHAY